VLAGALSPGGRRCADGRVESPLTELGYIGRSYCTAFNMQPRSFLKQDNALPICGSIKARGGVYEVLAWAETLAQDARLLAADDCRSMLLTDDAIRSLLASREASPLANLALKPACSARAPRVCEQVAYPIIISDPNPHASPGGGGVHGQPGAERGANRRHAGHARHRAHELGRQGLEEELAAGAGGYGA
jgi:hypothetical protein